MWVAMMNALCWGQQSAGKLAFSELTAKAYSYAVEEASEMPWEEDYLALSLTG